MHLAIMLFSIFAAWRWGDWRNFSKYHTTALYVVAGNFLYNFLYCNSLLWYMKPDIFKSHGITDFFYTLIAFPCFVLIFLSGYPKPIKQQLIHIGKFILIFDALELLLLKFDRIGYNHGWNIWWSLFWNIVMFPLIYLHHKRPIWAYILTIIFTVFILFRFPSSIFHVH